MGIGRAGWFGLAGAALGWAAWTLTLLGVPPSIAGAQAAFYTTLFLALSCTSACVLAVAAQRRVQRRIAHSAGYFLPHAALGSFLLLFGLWLQSLRMLTWPNTLLLIGLLVLIEGAYTLAKRRHWAG